MPSASDLAVRVRGLSKAYAIAHQGERPATLAESLLARARRPLARAPRETFWALKDVDFDIARGDVVGIIGRNGAGKSTLLKVLSRITEPTSGQVDLYGRVGSLLEVGTGFHPELSGRENVYLNGAILGMAKAEIRRQFDAIVDFADVERFLDTPVKRYSSGMYVRLAFAVAAHLNPEILIVDEVLAVGDAEFQKKCLGKMGEVASHGRTVLFVSHNLSAVQTLCGKAVWMESGRVRATGQTGPIVDRYQQQMSAASLEDVERRTDRAGNGAARCTAVVVRDRALNAVAAVPPCTPFYIDLTFAARESLRDVVVAAGINAPDGARIVTLFSAFTDDSFNLDPGRVTFRCAVDGLPLRPDIYSIETFIGHTRETFDHVVSAAALEVNERPFYPSGRFPDRPQGALLIRHAWTTVDGAESPSVPDPLPGGRPGSEVHTGSMAGRFE